jgi:hypothetical protein
MQDPFGNESCLITVLSAAGKSVLLIVRERLICVA